jgi:hypothetical protein
MYLTASLMCFFQVNKLFSRQDALNIWQILVNAVKNVIVVYTNGVCLWEMVVGTDSHSASEGTMAVACKGKQEETSRRRSGRARTSRK